MILFELYSYIGVILDFFDYFFVSVDDYIDRMFGYWYLRREGGIGLVGFYFGSFVVFCCLTVRRRVIFTLRFFIYGLEVCIYVNVFVNSGFIFISVFKVVLVTFSKDVYYYFVSLL